MESSYVVSWSSPAFTYINFATDLVILLPLIPVLHFENSSVATSWFAGLVDQRFNINPKCCALFSVLATTKQSLRAQMLVSGKLSHPLACGADLVVR
jgi:hypothetical protein